jgi:hypothetical protein
MLHLVLQEVLDHLVLLDHLDKMAVLGFMYNLWRQLSG